MKVVSTLALLLCSALTLANESDRAAIKTPEDAIVALKAGNERFVSGNTNKQDFAKQIEETKDGQAPYASILSCLDSRVPPEIIFDQGIGDLFVGRVAGNIEDINMLGSFEFAKGVVGTKLLVVMGHTSCGAVEGACQNAKLGSLTHLLAEIRPSVRLVEERYPDADVCIPPHLDEISEENIVRTIQDIRDKSPVIADLEDAGKLKVVGAMYDISTGVVHFMD